MTFNIDERLRDYQVEGLDKLREGIKNGHRSQLLYAPTGAGKTEIAIALMEYSRRLGRRSAMVMDRIVLCNQASTRLDSYGIEHGVLQASHWRYRPSERIQVCSAQTLEKRKSFPGLDLLIIDEAHQVRKSTKKFIDMHPGIKVIGLSATPFTKGLGNIFTNVVNTVTTKDLVDTKMLVPLRIFLAKEIDMTGAKKVAGEWSDAEATSRGIKITGDVVNEWIKKTHEIFGCPRKTIVFCASVAHGADLASKFNEAGYNFVPISYMDSDEYKKEVFEYFARPDTNIHGLIAVDILTKGFDCILEGSKILTDKGLVRIEEITLDAKIWDGHEFVSHSGVIYKGVRDVITYAGLTATADHLVKTKKGWIPFGDCAAQQIPIITTGISGKTIQEHESYFTRTKKGIGEIEVVCNTTFVMRLRGMWNSAMDELGCNKKRFLVWMSKLHQIKKISTMACVKVQTYEISLSTRVTQALSKLWWSWDSIQIQFATSSSGLDCKKSWDASSGQEYSDRSNQQRWTLRSWKFAMGEQVIKLRKHTQRWLGGKDSQIQIGTSRDKVCRQNIEESVFNGNEFRTNNPQISPEIRQTKGRVWDILNCGPRHSFTCEGLLVHNCPDVTIAISARPFSKSLSSHVQQMGRIMRQHPSKEFGVWLDHSGNYLRFQDEWDEIFEQGAGDLDDGREKTKPEPTLKEKEAAKCPRCGAMWGNADICTHCGFIREKRSKVIDQPGEMIELGNNKVPKIDNQKFYSELLFLVKTKGYKDGWAAYKYKEKFGVFPRSLERVESMPTLETLNWLKSKAIAFSKRK